MQAIPAELSGRTFPPIKVKGAQDQDGELLSGIGELDNYVTSLGGMKPRQQLKPLKPQEASPLAKLMSATAKSDKWIKRSKSIQVASLFSRKPSQDTPPTLQVRPGSTQGARLDL